MGLVQEDKRSAGEPEGGGDACQRLLVRQPPQDNHGEWNHSRSASVISPKETSGHGSTPTTRCCWSKLTSSTSTPAHSASRCAVAAPVRKPKVDGPTTVVVWIGRPRE